MATTRTMSYSEYFAELKNAVDPSAMLKLVTGTEYPDKESLTTAHEALLTEAEEAGDNKEYEPAAEAFRKESALAAMLDDNRMVESVSTQALYYGALSSFETLMDNYSTVWTMWAHMLPKLKPRDRARLGDFARFRRSFELGLREREVDDSHINAAVSLLAPTFDTLGVLNVKAMSDKKADITGEMAQLWQDTTKLVQDIETSVTA